MKCRAALILACFVSAACRLVPAITRAALDEQGSLFVYLDPLPPEAARLSFRLEEVEAVQEGSGSKLSLRLRDVEGAARDGERLLGSGDLPPGRYSHLALQVQEAWLGGEHGRSSLTVAAEPTPVAALFTIVHRKAVVLHLRLDYRASVGSQFHFSPVFSAAIPGPIVPGLLGLAVSRAANTVSFFDKGTGQIVAVVPTGAEPGGIVLDQSRRRAFVVSSGDDAVETIDLQQAAVVERARLTGGDRPVEAALTPDGRTLLSVDSGSNAVSYIDTQGLFVSASVPVGSEPRSILLDRQGKRAFVFNTLSDSISVLDVSGRAIVATIATDAGPLRGQLDRDGGKMYVIHASSPYLAVVDTVSLSVLRRIFIGAGATALRVDPQTDRIYVARAGAPVVDVYDPFSFLPVDTIPVEGDVSFLAYDSELKTLCLALPAARRVQCVRTVGGRTVTKSDVGDDPVSIALMERGERLRGRSRSSTPEPEARDRGVRARGSGGGADPGGGARHG